MTQRSPGRRLQAPLQEVPEEAGTDPLVLRGRLNEAEEHLLPGHRDPEGDDHCVRGKGLPVQNQGDAVIALQPPLLEGLELFRADPDEAPGDTRRAQAEGGGDRFRAGFVVAATQSHQDLPKEAGIGVVRDLELLIRP